MEEMAQLKGGAYLHLQGNKTYLSFEKVGPLPRSGPGDLSVQLEMYLWLNITVFLNTLVFLC